MPLEKVAVIALDTVLGSVLRCGNNGVKIPHLLGDIGTLLEAELNLDRLRAIKDNKGAAFARKKLTELSKNKRDSHIIYKNVKKILNENDSWSLALKVRPVILSPIL